MEVMCDHFACGQ
jgi:hypothetical protein